MEFLRKLERGFDKTMNVMLLLSGVIVIIDMLAVVQDVIIRKSFAFTWAPLYELVTYSLVWMTFLGTTAIYRDNGHVKLDSFLQMLPKRTQTLINFITSCAIVILCAFLCYLTARLNVNDYLNEFHLATILNPPKWPIEIIIPLSFFMLFIQAIRHSVSYFKVYRSGAPAQAEAGGVPPAPDELSEF
jgi:TRAP-type C4-dicarboxylate transport system permease small subunit